MTLRPLSDQISCSLTQLNVVGHHHIIASWFIWTFFRSLPDFALSPCVKGGVGLSKAYFNSGGASSPPSLTQQLCLDRKLFHSECLRPEKNANLPFNVVIFLQFDFYPAGGAVLPQTVGLLLLQT